MQLRIVLPGGHRLPRGLESTDALDTIRKSQMVWITKVESNVIEIHAETMKILRPAVKEVNWALHDMRQEERTTSAHVFVQAPTRASDQSRVWISGARPQVKDPTTMASSISSAIQRATSDLTAQLKDSTDALLGSVRDLEMRVNFGRLQMQRGGSGRASSLSYPQFEKMLKESAQRGDTGFQHRQVYPSFYLVTPLTVDADFWKSTEPKLC